MQLTTRELTDFTIHDTLEFWTNRLVYGMIISPKPNDLLTKLINHLIKVVTLHLVLQKLTNFAIDDLGNVIDILGLSDGLSILR